MTLPTTIAVIGAGSASFGENTLSAILRCRSLKGSTLRLVDHSAHNLDIVHRLAQRLNAEWSADFHISAHVDHRDALDGAHFVVNSIEVGPREQLWRSDYEIPLKYGVHQPYAENGGPGGFVHAARNIGPVMRIVHDMEQACPDAWLINFTNPMLRICDAVNRHSRIKVVGLCHQFYIGYCFAGLILADDLGFEVPEGIENMNAEVLQHPLRLRVIDQAVARLDVHAAGTNHFSWIVSIHDKQTGEDLTPLFRQRYASFNPDFEPLTRRVFEAFEAFPAPGDSHLCEYLPWASDPTTRPWEKYRIKLYDWEVMASLRDFGLDRLDAMAAGHTTVESLLDTDSEGALEIIENIAGAGHHYHQAANLPNTGQITNLPLGSIVETPVHVDGAGVHPVHMGSLPEGAAELCRRELFVARLCVDSAIAGDRKKALQCLLLDPVITDFETAQQILDDYLTTYREHLPQYWQ